MRLPSTKNKIHYFQRKRRSGQNFSLEQIFEDLRNRISQRYETKLVESPYISSGILKRLLNVLYAPLKQGDVNHITGDINYIGFLLRKKRTVLTILDCGILLRTKGIRQKVLRLIWFQLPVQRAKIVTVISEATKKHLLDEVKCDSNKIKIVHVPISTDFKYAESSFNTTKPKILQIGSAPNKNLTRLVKASVGIPCHLLIVGKISKDNKELLTANDISYENHIAIPFSEIINLYKICDIVYFASTYEGFGMPILEAQATGRVVITSNCASMPEVGGDGAHYVNPLSVEEINNGLLTIINKTEYRNNLVQKGKKNIERFLPEVIAEKYVSLYEQLTLKS